jgi:serine/threonine-protein kinase
MPRLEPGRVLAGKYRVERFLGEGAMGVVYVAEHELLRQKVALKLMRPAAGDQLQARARFLAEARNAARIQSDHVVAVMDVGILDVGTPFLVMELLDGANLAATLRARGGSLPISETVDWLLEAIDAIAHAHALGIVHRDLKPANLFLSRRADGTQRIKVLDFGISKATDPAGGAGITGTHAVLGTPSYMSPEQLRGANTVDLRTDIWALGVTAYELLTGVLPFQGDNPVALFATATATLIVPPRSLRAEIVEGLEAAVLRCLEPNPDDRFGSVAELASALAPYGTAAAAQTLARVQGITGIPPREESSPPSATARPTLAEEGRLSSSSSDSSNLVQESVSPWSDWHYSNKRPERGTEPPTGRWVRARAWVVLGGLALSIVAGLSYGIAQARRLPTPVAASGPPGAPVVLAGAREEPSQPLGAPSQVQTAPSAATQAPSGTSVAPATAPPRRVDPPYVRAPAKLSPVTSSPAPVFSEPLPQRGPSTAASASASPNCNPPYDIDALGHRQYKPECP